MKILIAGFLHVPRNIDKFRFIEERDWITRAVLDFDIFPIFHFVGY